MNKLEERYAENLELKRLAGEIRRWRFEPVKFEIAHHCTFTPDFDIITKDWHTEYHEVKGFMRDDAAVKLKVAARMYPQYKFILVKWDSKKGWIFKDIPK